MAEWRLQNHRVIRCDAVERRPAQSFVVERLQPDLDANPAARRDSLRCRRERVENFPGGRVAQAGARGHEDAGCCTAPVIVRVVESRDNDSSAQIEDSEPGPASPRNSAEDPTATMRASRIASASAHGRVESAVKTLPFRRIRSGWS